MIRSVPFVFAAFLAQSALAAPPSLDVAKLRLASANAIIVDAQDGTPLYSKAADEITPIASVTKLMTAMVVLDSQQPMDEALARSAGEALRAVRGATTISDKLMYLLLVGALVTGMVNTLGNVVSAYNYRETVSPWLRSLFTPHPTPELMSTAPLSFQVHVLIVFALFAIWPYTRLVHMFSAPVGYLVRPYVVYRSRDPQRASNSRYAKAWVTPQAPPERSRWV